MLKISRARNVVESGNTVSSLEDEPELIPREVLDIVESFRVALEIKFGENSVFRNLSSHLQSLSEDSMCNSLFQNQRTVEASLF